MEIVGTEGALLRMTGSCETEMVGIGGGCERETGSSDTEIVGTETGTGAGAGVTTGAGWAGTDGCDFGSSFKAVDGVKGAGRSFT